MGTIATTKKQDGATGFHRQMEFLEQEPQQEYKGDKCQKDFWCQHIIRQESVQTEPQPGEYLNGKEYFLKTACIGAHRHAETAVFHSGKRFFPPLQVGTNCHAGIDQHHSKKGVAE